MTATKEGYKMAQSMKNKIRKLADQYNIDSIIQTAVEVRNELVDEQSWNIMTSQEKTDWFLDQCKKYNLTTEISYYNDQPHRITVNELPCYDKAYFTVFFPRKNSVRGEGDDAWHLEIGGSYTDHKKNGGIWQTHPGLKGKEQQIAEVIRLHNLGE